MRNLNNLDYRLSFQSSHLFGNKTRGVTQLAPKTDDFEKRRPAGAFFKIIISFFVLGSFSLPVPEGSCNRL